MSASQKFWLNIDLPTNSARLHASGCKHETAKHETELKGIGYPKSNGGWFGFATPDAALRYQQTKYKNLHFSRCSDCL